MTKIRIGVVQVIGKNKTRIIGREVEVDKNWDELTVMDLKSFLKPGEYIHGYCLIDKRAK